MTEKSPIADEQVNADCPDQSGMSRGSSQKILWDNGFWITIGRLVKEYKQRFLLGTNRGIQHPSRSEEAAFCRPALFFSYPMSSSSTSPELTTKRKKILQDDSPDECDSASSDSESQHEPDEVEADEDEAPPLSHAEKRRQKKEKKEKESREPAKKKRKLADGKAKTSDPDKKHPTRQNSVWVGNMSYKTTPDALRAFFDGVGEITRINMPTKPSGRPGVPGENHAKTIAITLSERPLNGRKLLIKDGDSFEGRPKPAAADQSTGGADDQTHASTSTKSLSKTAQKILNQQKKPPAPTLFLGNLPFETTEESLRELLDAHQPKAKKGDKEKVKDGEAKKEDWIRRIRLGTFEDSGLCKGFAFVDFSGIEHATSALVNPRNHTFNGRKLVVEYASTEAVRRGPNKPKAEGHDTEGRGRGNGKSPRGVKHERNDKSRKSFSESDEWNPAAVPGDEHDQGDRYAQEAGQSRDSGAKRTRRDGTNHPNGKGPRGRPKPGAALAQAVRQSAAIVTNSNAASKKIVFD
ncbi:hypothetical protein D9758_004099 [Tetrapyrgos nigripes]|uniref:RRM domain-containing protein n=1 Tax=Tetrapyrgos nigripes TaxID=182062 RepID=A0A8H5LVM0_9AGAR|nr:hypothetical protein D9758_004099 [Tetrapyrgos nigripes]